MGSGDRHHRQAIGLAHLVGGRQRAGAAFLAVERDQHAGGFGPMGTDQGHRFAHRGAGRDDVVDDQHTAGQRRADQHPGLAVVLGLLAVEGDGDVAAVGFRQRDGGGRRQRDALVGGAEQHVEADPRGHRAGRVRLAELAQRAPRVEQPGVEEIRAHATGLEREFTEAQHVAAQGEVEEGALVVEHRDVSGFERGKGIGYRAQGPGLRAQ